jgi:hypothetical protein
MDDSEAINPREAAAGLGLIGALMVALVATFVYRTAMVRPTRPRPAVDIPALVNEASPSIEFSQEPLAPAGQESAPEATAGNEPDGPAESSPVVEIDPAAANAHAESEAPPFQPEPMPRFVAPSSRANQ